MQTLASRFWAKVNKHGPIVRPSLGRCWLWTGSQRGKDYGAVCVDGMMETAHRVAWFLATGKWPNPQALHKCDTRLCVRFSHLFEGTNADNVRDKESKGRGNPPVGERAPSAKLTWDDVCCIRGHLAAGVQGVILAHAFGVTPPIISRIKRGLIWQSKS